MDRLGRMVGRSLEEEEWSGDGPGLFLTLRKEQFIKESFFFSVLNYRDQYQNLTSHKSK